MSKLQREIESILSRYPVAADGSDGADLDVWTVSSDGEAVNVLAPLPAAVEIENAGHRVRVNPNLVSITKLHCCVGRMLKHGDKRNPKWARLEAVKPSTAQGWDVFLEGGVKLQSCWATGVHELA